MAAPRKKSPKKQAEEQVAELFGDPSPTEKARAKRARRKESDAVHREKHAAIVASLGYQPAEAEPDAPFGVVLSPENGYRPEPVVSPAAVAAATNNEGYGEELGVHGNASARVVDEHTIEVTGREVGTARARVVFHEVTTTRLEQIDYDDFGDYESPDAETFGVSKSRVDGAFVKVSAALRPSEREAFDGQALKEKLRLAGARAVLLAVHPVAEAPDQTTKEELTSSTLRPESAIEAWFAGLPVPEEDRAAAQALALEILAAEGG